MKTEEIEVWFKPVYFDRFLSGGSFISISTTGDSERTVKARLIFEIPEKKVTITESEFQKLYEDSLEMGPNSLRIVIETMRDKLFNE